MDWATIIAEAMRQGGNLLGGGGEQGTQSRIGRPEWWQQQFGLGQTRDRAMQLGQTLQPELLGNLRNAISGNMGLNPQAIQMMFGRQQQAMRPQFAQQQDQLRASFSPRLAGSGASAQSMQNLLTGQGQQMTGAMTDINIQDLMARFGMMGQGLGQMGQMFGQNLQATSQAQGNILRWLGM